VFLDRDGVILRPIVRDGRPYPPRALAEVRRLVGETARAYGVAPLTVVAGPYVRGLAASYRPGLLVIAPPALTGPDRDAIVAHEVAHHVLGHAPPPVRPGSPLDDREEQARRELEANAKSVEILVRVKGWSERTALRAVYDKLLRQHRTFAAGQAILAPGHRPPCEEIRDLQQRLRVTAIYVTHDQEEAMSMSDRIVLMDRAAVVEDGPPRVLYEAPRTEFAATFMGEANVVEGRLARQGDGDEAVVELGEQQGRISLRVPHRGVPDGPVRLSIRPESVRLSRADTQAPPSENGGLAGTTEHAVWLGSHVEYVVRTSLGLLQAVSPDTEVTHAAGTDVHITISTRSGVTVLVP
jgi:hypothetical protein